MVVLHGMYRITCVAWMCCMGCTDVLHGIIQSCVCCTDVLHGMYRVACVAESLTRLETDQKAHSSNYTGGEKAGQSWTDKVMGVKQTQEVPDILPQDQQEGVDDDEWVSKEGGRMVWCRD